MGDNTRGWYWTPEQLEKLRRVIDTLAQRDAEGSYLGPTGLEGYVAAYCREHGLDMPYRQIGTGLAVLRSLGILEPSRGGSRSKDYKRRYHTEHPPVTAADVQRYRDNKRGTL